MGGGHGLLGGEPLLQCGLCCLGFAGHLLPEGLLVLSLTKHSFGGVQTLGGVLMRHNALFEHLAEAGELSVQIGAFVRWGLRGDEGAGLNEGLLKVRWNQSPSCQVILSTARAARWSPTMAWLAALPARRTSPKSWAISRGRIPWSCRRRSKSYWDSSGDWYRPTFVATSAPAARRATVA